MHNASPRNSNFLINTLLVLRPEVVGNDPQRQILATKFHLNFGVNKRKQIKNSKWSKE